MNAALCPVPRKQPESRNGRLVISLPWCPLRETLAILDAGGARIGSATLLASQSDAARIHLASNAPPNLLDQIRAGSVALQLEADPEALRVTAGSPPTDFVSKARESLRALLSVRR